MRRNIIDYDFVNNFPPFCLKLTHFQIPECKTTFFLCLLVDEYFSFAFRVFFVLVVMIL